jgi:hypothetical protein
MSSSKVATAYSVHLVSVLLLSKHYKNVAVFFCSFTKHTDRNVTVGANANIQQLYLPWRDISWL